MSSKAKSKIKSVLVFEENISMLALKRYAIERRELYHAKYEVCRLIIKVTKYIIQMCK